MTVPGSALFQNAPARLKFMRGARTEAAQIGAVVRQFALARPDRKVDRVQHRQRLPVKLEVVGQPRQPDRRRRDRLA